MRTKENKTGKILVLCTIFVVSQTKAQDFALKDSASKAFQNSYRYINYPVYTNFSTIKAVSPNFYVKNLGFFCRQELKLEAITTVPFKFRLGSINYCDWMEGKKNAGILPAP